MRSSRRVLTALLLSVLVGPLACHRPPRPAPTPPTARPAAPTAEPKVDVAVSDVATGGSWQEGGQSGVYRIVVRSGGRRNLRSEVVLSGSSGTTAGAAGSRSAARSSASSRGGIIVTATRIDQEEGRAVAKVSVANAVTGVGRARVWPQGLPLPREAQAEGERE
jgi:hypothetical protein